jgi:aryl-alcohol dehydrogenase-like predicted oxidoreductase/ferredoxin
MEKRRLGHTGLEVTRLCLGTLPMGPLQLDLPVEEGAQIVRRAVEGGVNFIDTAHAYGTYDHIRRGLKGIAKRVIIATKTSARTKQDAEAQIGHALESLGRKQLDLVHLHAARLLTPFEERAEVWDYLLEAKRRGIIRHVGIATHAVEVVKQAADKPEVEVIHPLINLTGMGIQGGNADEMLQAIRQAQRAGKGIYAMKPLAGGNLIERAPEAFSYILTQQCIDAVAVGMVSLDEVALNLRLFESGHLPLEDWNQISLQKKRLKILKYCDGCGSCLKTCPNEALSIVAGKARVDETRCILCGYCAPACPQFYIRVN